MKGKTVLVVASDKGMRDLLKMALEEMLGAYVEAAQDAEEVIRSARELQPSLLVLDTVLREHGSLEIVRLVKSHPGTQSVPVIVIMPWEAGREEAMAAGADGYVEKPFELDLFLREVRKHLPSQPESGMTKPPTQLPQLRTPYCSPER